MPSSKSTSRFDSLLDRRTVIVWLSLIGSMTGASALLLTLQPQPLAPAGGLALSVVDADRTPTLDAVFNTQPSPAEHGWRRIVVHHSGQSAGNAQSLGKLHQQLGYGSLGYHFVIGNGQGAEDGVVQVGYRWVNQIDGQYAPASVSVCLVGNGDRRSPTGSQLDQLVRLVNTLQLRLNIPADRVYLHSDLADTTSPGRLFPAGRFRQQLLDLPTGR